jgi:hypothetical protein
LQFIVGDLKVQHGIYRVREILNAQFPDEKNMLSNVAGYAIFDLNDQIIGGVMKSFQETIAEIGRLP